MLQADAFVSTRYLLRHCASGLLGAFAKLQKVAISFVMSVGLFVRPSVRPSVRPFVLNDTATTERIFVKFYI
jgi:hypothetical protein